MFAELPRIIESAGLTKDGSVTAFFTVLAEDESLSDPVAEEARSLLDGHIQLSGKLGAAGHYPAIDILRSKSRLMTRVAGAEQLAHAQRAREWLSRFEDIELLLQIGEYERGSDAANDLAIERRPAIDRFLQQPHDTHVPFDATRGGVAFAMHGRRRMIAQRAEAKLWTLLARVRDLRVRRRHVALARAEDNARAAAAEVAARRAARDAHAQQLAPILRGCAHGNQAAAIWRQTFSHHQARAQLFEREIERSSSHEADALAELRRARLALRREMLSRTDAENRARQIARDLLDEG